MVSTLSAIIFLFLILGSAREMILAHSQRAQATDGPGIIDSYTHMVRLSQETASKQRAIPILEVCPTDDSSELKECEPMQARDLIDQFMMPVFKNDADKIFLSTYFYSILREDMHSLNRHMKKEVKKIPELADAGLYLAIRFQKHKAREWLVHGGFEFRPRVFSQIVKNYQVFSSVRE